MIRTGVDWSGSPGDPLKNPRDNGWLVFTACHLDERDTVEFENAVAKLKRDLGLRDDHVFKHAKSTDTTRSQYFRMLAGTQVRATALCIDKRSWDSTYFEHTSGPRQTVEALVECILCAPDTDVSRQVLLVDTVRAERGFLNDLRRALRQACRTAGRESFRKISPRPDHRSDALLIQAADMIAGDLRRNGAGTSQVEKVMGLQQLQVELRQ